MDNIPNDTQKRARGRPRAFDSDAGVETALGLFHARGYDAVGTAELCTAIGVRPPSLYAAYGSKLGLYERALERYRESPMATFVIEALTDASDPDEAIRAVLLAAAEFYGADPERRGCMALEGSVAPGDANARERAAALVEATGAVLRERLAALGSTHPDADADAVLIGMRGLSAAAKAGASEKQLHDAARRLVAMSD